MSVRQLEEALDSAARMLGSRTVKAMWKQHNEAVVEVPLRLAGNKELVDHNLCTIGKVTKLSFPQGQRVWKRRGIAVLESKHCIFRQMRTAGNKLATFIVFSVHRLGDWAIVAVFILVEYVGVSVRESPALDILS